MDFLKKAAEGVSGNKEHTQQNPAAGGTAAPAQQKDYGDKVADQIFDRSGYGNKVSESNREKITDFARGQYEKATGSKVDPKYSN